MSFDPFEARMQFLQLLRKLNASQQSIQKVVGYAIKYGSKCGEDLWECILEECAKGSLNTRINLLYLLDTLLETSLPLPLADAPYPPLIAENLTEIVKRVVPEGEGVLNLRSAKQILESWRTRRLIEPDIVDVALRSLDEQKGESSKRSRSEAFSKGDIIRRMEEDRERHKRLRERIWVLPIPPLTHSARNPLPTPTRTTNPSPASGSGGSPYTPASPSTKGKIKGSMSMPPPPAPGSGSTSAPAPGSGSGTNGNENGNGTGAGSQNPLDVEFDQLWEGCSDLDPEDLERMREDSLLLESVQT